MERQKVWLFFLYLLWITIDYTTSNQTWLDNINKEFGVRLKKLSSDYYIPRTNTLRENTYQKFHRAGHETTFPTKNHTKQKNFTHRINGLSSNFKVPQNASKKTFQYFHNKQMLNNTKLKDNKEKHNLVQSQNLHFNDIEPFWPFSNLTASFLDQAFKPQEQNNAFPFNKLPDRFKDTTFFFSHVGPNRFEYRAQFHHNHDKVHEPKDYNINEHYNLNKFPEFPKITFPPFPTYPAAPEIFHQQPHFPAFPNFNPFAFPTLPPPIKRNLGTPAEPKVHDHENNHYNNDPYNRYDIVLGNVGSQYPKIFRFNEERINIADFEKDKKRRAKLNALNYNLLQPENVQRDHLLILHGGIFTVQEPPLYHRKVVRKRRQRLRKRIGKI